MNIDFHKAELSDREWVKDILEGLDFMNCEYGFGTMFIWSEAFGSEIGRYGDVLLMRSAIDGGYIYSIPVGKGDVKKAVEYLVSITSAEGRPLRFYNTSSAARDFLNSNFPNEFEYIQRRDFYDYVYLTKDLITLSGRRYHQKRNHISKFKNRYNWSFEKICASNIAECRGMYERWLREKDAENDEEYIEYDAVKKALDNFDELGFIGGILRVDGNVVAFTLGEALNSEVFCTHIEKADVNFEGAYAMINNQFALNCLSDFEYINREEDMGIEGLRKSKLSYHPAVIFAKDLAVHKGNV